MRSWEVAAEVIFALHSDDGCENVFVNTALPKEAVDEKNDVF